FLVIVVNNQPGIAKGTLTAKRLKAINRRLSALLAEQGAQWDALYYCPHHPGPGMRKNPFARKCQCRKPKPGLILQAARKHSIDLPSSWMVGDGLNDIQAGKAAGCRSILVADLKIEQVERFFDLSSSRPDAVARDLQAASQIILKAKTRRKK
ncbi:MAG: HAD-IIIA family hydrolase, partial [Kiritimatiellia bacterium]